MVANELREARRKLGLSQMLLAQKTNISRYRISLFEMGYIKNLKGDEVKVIKSVLRGTKEKK